MLNSNIKRALVNSIPDTFRGVEVKRSFGKNPYDVFENPVVNLTTPVDGVLHYRPIDDFAKIENNSVYNTDIRRTVLRFKVAATDAIVTSSEKITFALGTSKYKLTDVPVKELTSVGSFAIGTDCVLIDRDTIEWIGATPADGEAFTVEYLAFMNGYWLANDIAEQLKADVRANLERRLADYKIRIDSVSDNTDISVTYADDKVSAFAFDVRVVYPWSWSRELTEEDGTLIELINVTVENNETFTIE